MSSITKRPDGRYRARYRDSSGREHAKHFQRRVDAQRWLDEVTTSIVTGQYADPRAGKETVKAYAERWRLIQPHRESTAALYERVLRLHLYPVWGDRPISSIRHSDARAFVTRLGTTLAPNSVRQVHAVTRTIFASAVADKVIQSSPFSAMKLPAVQRSRVEPPSFATVQTAVTKAPDRLAALVVLAAGTGLRSGELLGLDPSRVDFLRREVRVDRQLVYIPGRPPFFAPPKTAESVRTVPLPTFVTEALAEHLARFPVANSDLIFQAEKGGPVLRTTLNGRWRRTLRNAKLPETIRLHHLRHAYASLLIGAGVPFTTVGELLGHTPQGVTWAVYTHRVEGWDRQVRTVLDEAWEAALAPAADSVRTDVAQ